MWKYTFIYKYFLIVIAIIILGCGSDLKDEQSDSSSTELYGTVESNWQPKDFDTEWWYITGELEDESGKKYFYQFTIFHVLRFSTQGYVTHIAVSDYQTKEHFFEEDYYLYPHEYSFTHDTINVGTNTISLNNNQIKVNVSSENIKYEFLLNSNKPTIWHGGDGIISMGHPDNPEENSFYHSLTSLNTVGSLSFINEKDELINLKVTGKSWFDRQWGNFLEERWDWFSLRFSDGEEVMLFSFPTTGHKEATFILNDGSVKEFTDFHYDTEEYITVDGITVGYGWNIKIPMKDEEYTIVPLSQNDMNANFVVNYWEGLCKILDSKGEFKGWAVVEVTE